MKRLEIVVTLDENDHLESTVAFDGLSLELALMIGNAMSAVSATYRELLAQKLKDHPHQADEIKAMMNEALLLGYKPSKHKESINIASRRPGT